MLNVIILISSGVFVVCTLLIIFKFINYFKNKKQLMHMQRNNAQNIEILQLKIPEMKLKNKGHSLDENIKLIYNDENVIFSMEWGNILG